MDTTSPKAPATTFRELSVDLRAPYDYHIVHLQLPSAGAFGRTGHTIRKVRTDTPSSDRPGESSKDFSADSSGICFRASGKYPRNILWRILEDGYTLEIRSTDLSKSATEAKEANVTIQLKFPDSIRRECVGISDADRGDFANVFVLLRNNELYTFTLPTSFLCQVAASDEELEKWCQSSRLSSLSSSQAFKLTSCSSNELIFSLSDGRISRLTRQQGADGRGWTENLYTDAVPWSGSFRGLIGWQSQNKVRYEGLSLDHNTTLAAQTSPDGKHLLTVTMNHCLKIWNIQSGKPTVVRDLSGDEWDQNTAGKILLDPGMNQILSVESGVRAAYSGDKYYLVSFSPQDGGSFRVWGVRDADFGGEGVRDLYPQQVFRIPDPDDGALWTLADYKVLGDPSTDKISFWVMLRLNKRYQLFHKVFGSFQKMADEWNDSWERTSVDSDKSRTKNNNMLSEPHGLYLDSTQQLPWILSAIAASPIRSCTETEILAMNDPALVTSNSALPSARSIEGGNSISTEAAIIVGAASQLRASLDHRLIEEAVRAELWQDPSLATPERMQAFYDSAGLSALSDRDYDELFNAVNSLGGEDSLSDTLFMTVLETFPEQVSQGSKLSSTRFGRQALVVGATEVIALQERIVCDLLCVIVLIDQEVDRTEKEMKDLNTLRMFEELVGQLRFLQIMQWISVNKAEKNSRSVTVLDLLFAGDIRPQPTKHQSGCSALSGTIKDLIKWIGGGNDASMTVEQVAVTIQCYLLVGGHLELATAFLRYQPSTAWATYVRGRYCLHNQDFISAATYFKKAAFKLSREQPTSSFYRVASVGLIETLELSNFASGLCNFYTHVVHLFSASETFAHLQTVHFASLALQHFPISDAGGQSSARQSHRSDLLARIFQSSLALKDYDKAFSALVRYTDNSLRKVALRDLVTGTLRDQATSKLVSLPFPAVLKPEVDSLLSDMVRTEAESGRRSTRSADAVKVLYAWKVQQGDYRGAAACIIERLHAQRASRKEKRRRHLRNANDNEEVLIDYVIAINALSMLGGEQGVEDGENEGWVFVEDKDGEKSRSIVRLRDLRREYQKEMDLREKWEKGRFALTAGDSDDEDEDAMVM